MKNNIKICLCIVVFILIRFDLYSQETKSKSFYCGLIRDGSVQVRISFFYDASKFEITKIEKTTCSFVPSACLTWALDKKIKVSKKDGTFTFNDGYGISMSGKVDAVGKFEGIVTDKRTIVSAFTLPPQNPLGWVAVPINAEKFSEKIQQFDKSNVNLATEALQHLNPDIRLATIKSLFENGSDVALVVLRNALTSEFLDVRWNAALALGYSNDAKSIPLLISSLNDNNTTIKWTAAKALGMLHAKDAIAPLLKFVQNENIYVRWFSIEALSNFDDPQVSDYFNKALAEKDSVVISSGRKYYIALATDEAINALIDILNSQNDLQLTTDLLNSKNSKLIDAVHTWAKKHGYSVRAN